LFQTCSHAVGLSPADDVVKVRVGRVLTGVRVFVFGKNEPERIAAKVRPLRWFPVRSDLQEQGCADGGRLFDLIRTF
jgi:hypothetical protein